ncbi:cation:proton antiporter [Knoellia sp. 3-2P3]|uniref:cation:proton antiporter n=1 Tax=unclassified Knoellia TaxID=2618719 RepID=UPI0023DCE28F|nr:cation:proton antiporter [Knoellia sp. 3-2P3]MDF2093469.1 cation:proton antiporter [Knoellia sp. 3-2P3]
MGGADFAHTLVALALLLAAAHGVGHLFTLLRQPRVIGEIAGGLVLGPTLLGYLWPDLQARVFPTEGSVAAVLGWASQLGLLLLMFCSGAEMRSLFRRDESRLVGLVTVTGVVLPFAAGALLFRFLDSEELLGPAQNGTALMLVFGLAIAVTSIPVISRIMLDLGVIESSFARIVLGVAVIEDVVVYVVLALALGMVSVEGSADFGVPGLLGLEAGSTGSMVFHGLATLAVFALMLTLGPRGFRWTRRQRWNLVASSNPLAYLLLFIFGGALLCIALGVTALFGAFLAGIAASAAKGPKVVAARESIRSISFAFFIPVYFATVGLQLDLVRHFDIVFFAWFLLFACLAKSGSVYLGARLAGEGSRASRNLAIATNARGGPGIVLASVTYAAGIISQEFYAALVMLALVTSMLAGTWLGHIVRSGRPLRPDDRATLPRAGVPGGPSTRN